MYTVATKISQVGKVHKPQLNLTAQEFTKTSVANYRHVARGPPFFSQQFSKNYMYKYEFKFLGCLNPPPL